MLYGRFEGITIDKTLQMVDRWIDPRTSWHGKDVHGRTDVQRLLNDDGILRHRGKFEAVINNAHRARELVIENGSLADFLWRYEPDPRQIGKPQTASTSAESIGLSKALKKQGWKFVGPTRVYAFMQAMGLINDHVQDCVIRIEVDRARQKFRRPKVGGK